MKRKAKRDLVAIHLADQAPRIGSGYRLVEVVTVGHKWVTVRSWPAGPKHDPIRHKFRKADWETVSSSPASKPGFLSGG